MQNVKFAPAAKQDMVTVLGRDLFTDELRETLGQFEQAKNFGSLIVPKLRDPAKTLRMVKARDFSSDLLLKEVQERIIAVLRMAEALSPKYHVVVANPPYMGGKGMNGDLASFARREFADSKADLYAMFMERQAFKAKAGGSARSASYDPLREQAASLFADGMKKKDIALELGVSDRTIRNWLK